MFKPIKCPVLTEKTTRQLETRNQYVFEVDSTLTKVQVRRWLENEFLIHTLKINTHRPPHKTRRRRKVVGCIPNYKRVIVTLPKEEKISYFSKLLHFLFL